MSEILFPECVNERDREVIRQVLALCSCEVQITKIVNTPGERGLLGAYERQESVTRKLVRAMGYTKRDQAKAVFNLIHDHLNG